MSFDGINNFGGNYFGDSGYGSYGKNNKDAPETKIQISAGGKKTTTRVVAHSIKIKPQKYLENNSGQSTKNFFG